MKIACDNCEQVSREPMVVGWLAIEYLGSGHVGSALGLPARCCSAKCAIELLTKALPKVPA